jgi:protein-S-isoprenylcysteine O-methyltransferase Ste14
MTNELLGYIKDAIQAVLYVLVILGVFTLTGEQLAAIGTAVVAVGALVLAWNSRRAGGAPQVLKAKAAAAENAGIVTSEGPPPTTP